MNSLTLALIACLTLTYASPQTKFKTVNGTKANYTVDIPNTYTALTKVGANVDLKFGDKNGATINTVVTKLPSGLKENQLVEMSYPSVAAVKNDLEAQGLEDVSIIKRGMTTINGTKTYYEYYTSNVDGSILYYHTITQFHDRKILVLICACEYSQKHSYMAYINRTVNSLKYK